MRQRRGCMEYIPINIADNWQTSTELPAGVRVQILSDDMDEIQRVGARTKLVRFNPGAATSKLLCHDFWEEAYLLSGDVLLDCNECGVGGRLTSAPAYACRPPGTPHGRMMSSAGCVLLEFQYYLKEID